MRGVKERGRRRLCKKKHERAKGPGKLRLVESRLQQPVKGEPLLSSQQPL
jgi:hypothetical protein